MSYFPAHKLGQQGEKLAADFLIKKGYHLLATNVRFKLGEIDLLMQKAETIVLVEVKTQKNNTFQDPVFKISPAKYNKLMLLGSLIAARYPNNDIQIDVVTVCWSNQDESPTVKHLENCVS